MSPYTRTFTRGTLHFNIYIISSFVAVAGIFGVQRFEQQPSYTEVNPGQDALLVCKIFSKRGSCSWQKDNKVRRLLKK